MTKQTEKTTTNLNVYQRVNKVMSELSYLKKTAKIGYGNNTYSAITHDHVTESIQPLCVKYGLVLIPEMTDTKIERYTVTNKRGESSERYETITTVVLTVINMDNPEDRFNTQATAHAFDNQDKSSGKAYSMAVKYCHLKTFMLASGDKEEDRNEETKIVCKEMATDKQKKTLFAILGKEKYNENKGIIENKMTKEMASVKIKELNDAKAEGK